MTLAALLLTAAIDVLSYDVRMVVSPDVGALQADETIVVTAPPGSRATFAAAGLEVRAVRGAGGPLTFEHRGEELHVQLGRGNRHTLEVEYAARPGLKMSAAGIWGAYHTWKWMVANRDPSDRAQLSLTLDLPADLVPVFSGQLVRTLPASAGRARYRFETDDAHPAYTFGLAAGRLAPMETRASGVSLRLLAPPELAPRLGPLLQTTARMLRFFSERAGMGLPHRTYAQVFLPDAPAQEMAGMALMSTAYAESLLADPKEDWLVAHELSHQWWGNLVTCADWGQFWLNEGFASFMGAAWKEHAWGSAAYERELTLAYTRLGKARREGRNRPLVLPKDTPESAAGGTVPYQRGFLFLDALRRELKDEAFWKAIRAYTKDRARRGATSDDLRRAMEKASDRDLKPLFAAWLLGDAPECSAAAAALPAVKALEPAVCPP